MRDISLFLFASAALLGCTSHVSSSDGAGGAAVSTSSGQGPTGSGPSTTTSGTAGTGGAPPAGLTLTMGPVAVPPGTERTQCITQRLGNSALMHVGQIYNQLSTGSHHLIVYRSTDTNEQLVPYDCQPFADTLSQAGGGPLMITQKKQDSLVLPQGVAFNFDPNQMIRLEVHYINPTPSEIMVEAHSTFVPMPDAEFQNEAALLFAGTTAVYLPPNQATTAGQFINMPSDLVGKHFFGFTGHVHRMGTNVHVLMGQSHGTGLPVYEVPGFTWSEPPTQYHDPPVDLAAGDGFDITCEYQNTTSSPIGFGESANDEMCFFWAYYFPSVGPKIIF